MSAEREGLRKLLEAAIVAYYAEYPNGSAWPLADRLAALLPQTQPMPYEDDEGRTHWEGCWRERGHHNCAVEMVERLTQAQEPVAWMCMVGKGDVWEVDLVTEHRGVVQEWERESHGIERGMARVVPLVPVAASPVASALDSILRLEGEYTGVRYGEAAIPEKVTAAEVFERIRASAPEEEREECYCPVDGYTGVVWHNPGCKELAPTEEQTDG